MLAWRRWINVWKAKKNDDRDDFTWENEAEIQGSIPQDESILHLEAAFKVREKGLFIVTPLCQCGSELPRPQTEYAAPEQQGMGTGGFPVDVWALGITLYEVVKEVRPDLDRDNSDSGTPIDGTDDASNLFFGQYHGIEKAMIDYDKRTEGQSGEVTVEVVLEQDVGKQEVVLERSEGKEEVGVEDGYDSKLDSSDEDVE
ncbi:hypothetical protein BGZ89_010261 [Linnemannia elongata]|nr:hypothetical protein BGZ89_010261 [Linnemannia elongata]